MNLRSDLVIASAVVCLLFLFVAPLPAFALDIFLSLSLLLSLIALLLTFHIEHALEFSSFPSLLLFLTLFRLALNIASTRMILTHGEAGKIIHTFGAFVTQGSILIGLIIFALLTLINFIVVTKGSSRVAEVAARFNLEAIAGKQMAIDSDLTSGMITGDDAKKLRTKLSSEAEFYGAMDGASKFVRGDCIAGIIIILVNIVGGFYIGVTEKHLPLDECLKTYTLLTVGDGLVTQLPALLLSVSAGIMVTRVSTGRLGRILTFELLHNPKVLTLSGAILALISFIPGMPKLVMLPLALALFLYARSKKQKELIEMNPIVLAIELGASHISKAEDLLERVALIRQKIARELGLVIPFIHICDNLSLRPSQTAFKIKGVTVATFDETGFEPLCDALLKAIVENAYQLINRENVTILLESAKSYDGAVVDELIPSKLGVGELLKILQNLLKEHLSIKDIGSILETLADQIKPGESKDIDALTECVRQRLSGGIVEQLFGNSRVVHAITLDPKVEQMLSASLRRDEGRVTLALRPMTREKIEGELALLLKRASDENIKPAILTNATVRPHLRRLVEEKMREIAVLSYAEVGSKIEIQKMGMISQEVLI